MNLQEENSLPRVGEKVTREASGLRFGPRGVSGVAARGRGEAGELCSRPELLVRTEGRLSARRVSGVASPPRCLDGVCAKRGRGPEATRGVWAASWRQWAAPEGF